MFFFQFTRQIRRRLVCTYVLGLLVIGCLSSKGQQTSFTYQGRLLDAGIPATGLYDIRFSLYDISSGGTGLVAPVTNETVNVEGGVFSVEIDFGATVFDGSDRWLEVAVRPAGNGGFTALSPRQPIHPVPYAIHAQTASSVPDGTITGSMLAPGTITSDRLADGSVDSTKLARPYLSGTIPYSNLTGSVASFGTLVSERAVSFSTAFENTPVITHSMDTPHPALSGKGPVLVSSGSPTGFTLRIPWGPVGVEVFRRAGGITPSLAMIDGHPAVVGSGQIDLSLGLTYRRALDAEGTTWAAPTILEPGYPQKPQLMAIGNRPAVVFVNSVGGVSFLRANDIQGDDWPAPIQIYDPASFGAMSRLALEIVSGNPAVLMANSSEVLFMRADDSNGSTWGEPVSLEVLPGTPAAIDLGVIGGRPLATVLSEQAIQFSRAADANGDAWPSFTDAVPDPNPSSPWDGPFSQCQLVDVGGVPGIGYVESEGINHANQRIMFVMADDSTGTSWNLPQTVTALDPQAPSISFHVVNDDPAVAFIQDGQLHFIQSFGSPPFFTFPVPSSVEAAVGDCALTVADGQPAIAFEATGSVRFIRNNTRPPDSAVNWIAVEP